MSAWKRSFQLVIAILIPFIILSGCEIPPLDGNLIIYTDEEWEFTLALPPEWPEYYFPGESPSSICEELLLELGIEEDDPWPYGELDCTVNLEPEGEQTIRFILKGKGLADLRLVMEDFLWGYDVQLYAEEVIGRRQIHLNVNADLISSFTLIGGSIISSNGQQIDDKTVVWVEPSGRIEAVFTEKSRITAAGKAVLIAGALLVIFFAYRSCKNQNAE